MEIAKEMPKEITAEEPSKDVNENEDQEPSPEVHAHSDLIPMECCDPKPPVTEFVYARDNDFTTQTWQIKSEVQAGEVDGHFLRIHENRVSADAPKKDPEAVFKIHCFYDNQLDQDLWIFESAAQAHQGKAIAIVNNKVVVKRIKGALTSITQVQATNPEIIFVKKPLSKGSCVFTLSWFSSSSSKKYYLGFDKINGSVMDPTKVRPSQREAKFKIF